LCKVTIAETGVPALPTIDVVTRLALDLAASELQRAA